LYKEKDKYFEMKALEINTKLEEELKECTFSPKRITKKNYGESS
jgi:hypothetical protein